MFNVLIIDGYPLETRDLFKRAQMSLGGELYAKMLFKYRPQAKSHILYISDPQINPPNKNQLEKYDAVLWPGCNLSVYQTEDQRVSQMIHLSDATFEIGLPQFGSCWGLQLATWVAGGEIKANPKGWEVGVGRKIYLNEDGQKHPLYRGKPLVFDAFQSHVDHIVKLPNNCTLLASNHFSKVQAAEIKYKRGTFWGTQYHLEYNLHEMARLMVARDEKLIRHGFFKNKENLHNLVEKMEELSANSSHHLDLKWSLGIDNDLLNDKQREQEFINWLAYNC